MARDAFEYPDVAGYPDGSGFLDQGTALSPEDGGSLEYTTPSAEAETEFVVRDDVAAFEFQALIGRRVVGLIRYAGRDSGPLVLRSTFVEPVQRGRGIATALIAHVLDDLRDRGQRVAVECGQIRGFIDAHPEYRDLVVPASPPRD
ncbi:GNAT family N-acetyltransferase [Lysobacter korlensis]|uniref:GNAT family N-acetyltransferase n=1 Tax=Lysobacter korlensis TaxID=553636 RepID=A0ABV6RVN6_9GAMM